MPDRRALLVVDVQNDFAEGGALGVVGGRSVASSISAYLDAHADDYAAVIASRDWHDADSTNGGHFAEAGVEPNFTTTWPVHCVAGTSGAEYAPELAPARITHHVKKGMGVPAYSMFEAISVDGESLTVLLDNAGVTSVDVVGIATDYCVRATVLDALEQGLAVKVRTDMVAGVAPETTERALLDMIDAGATC